MMRLDRILRDYADAGAMNGQIALWGFVDDHTFLTKSGHVGLVYRIDGASRLEQHLRETTARTTIVVAPADLQIVGTDATAASAPQWSVIQQLQARLPDAEVKLREHRLSWRREPAPPVLSVYGVLATRQVGPFMLRREFAVPER